nr:hypothetical protein [Acidobacteriota bacterium]
MKRNRFLLPIILVVICVASFATGYFSVRRTDIERFHISQPLPPNSIVFKKIIQALENFRDQRPFKDQWVITPDQSRGTIETNWFPNHKGEVMLKVQISVWGNSFHLDVWQKVSLTNEIVKTERSRLTEMGLQLEIDTLLRQNLSTFQTSTPSAQAAQ